MLALCSRFHVSVKLTNTGISTIKTETPTIINCIQCVIFTDYDSTGKQNFMYFKFPLSSIYRLPYNAYKIYRIYFCLMCGDKLAFFLAGRTGNNFLGGKWAKTAGDDILVVNRSTQKVNFSHIVLKERAFPTKSAF